MKSTLFSFILFFLFCFLLTPSCLGFNSRPTEGIVVEFQGENNLFDIILQELEKALPGVGEIPAEVFYRRNIFLSLPWWQGESTVLGLSYRQKVRCQVTGQTLDFYRCLAVADYQTEQKFYDLRGEYLEYTQLGGYISKSWGWDSILAVLRGDLFMCYDFYYLSLLGQGRISDLGGSNKYELYGDVQRDWSDSNNPPGWGYTLSFNFYYEQSGFSLSLALNNLLGELYFSELRHDNDLINTKEASIGPLPVKGFTTIGPFYCNIPMMAELQAAYTLECGGRITVDFFSEEEIRSYAVGYQQPFGKIALITAFNPNVMSLDFGLAMDNGELVLSFGVDTTALKGINFRLRF